MIHTVLNNENSLELFDTIYSADSAKIYKPSPKVYKIFDKESPEKTIFISSNAWDIYGATSFGFDTIWINRQNKPKELLKFQPRRTINTLTDF